MSLKHGVQQKRSTLKSHLSNNKHVTSSEVEKRPKCLDSARHDIKLITMKILAFVLICFQVSFVNAKVKEDSLKSSPDSYRDNINDPRNPNCPCHKYQKLADEEYRKLLGKEIKLKPEENKNDFNNSLGGGSNLNSNNKTSAKKFHSLKRLHSLFNFKKKKSSKRRKVRRLRRDNTSCYHF